MAEIFDHLEQPVKHGRARVNEIRMHYVTAGQGEPLLLLHGTPKTHFYWYKLIPLLTPHFQVVAPDLRGFGDTDKPPAEEGYQLLTNARDMAELMTALGHQTFHLHGEDRGAESPTRLLRPSEPGANTVVLGDAALGRGARGMVEFHPRQRRGAVQLARGLGLAHSVLLDSPSAGDADHRSRAGILGIRGSRRRLGTRTRSPRKRSTSGLRGFRRRAGCAAASRRIAPGSRTPAQRGSSRRRN